MGNEISRVVSVPGCESPDRESFEFRIKDSMTDETVTPRSDVSAAEEFLSPVGSNCPPGNNNVLIFDWDDTLLCSTALNQKKWDMDLLQQLEVAVDSTLQCALELGETLIVTNGNATWVEDSASKFLPGLLPTLSHIKVVSARARCEKRYPGDPFMWKKVTFREVLLDEREVRVGAGLNLVACGDQNPEIDAAHNVIKSFGGPCAVKTVKFKEVPSVSEIIGQLAKLKSELPDLVASQRSSHGTLTRRTGFGTHRHAEAEAWKFTNNPKVESSWGFPRSLSMNDLWPLFS